MFLSFVIVPTILQVIGLLLAELTRSVLLSMAFFTTSRTGARARAMVLTLVYNKVSKLRNVGDKSIGEVNNPAVTDFAIQWNQISQQNYIQIDRDKRE